MKKYFKLVILLFVLLFSFTFLGCKEDTETNYQIKTYKCATKYDYYEFSGRGYYELKDEANYKVQETYTLASSLSNFGIIQTYADYQAFISKLSSSNFNYTEDFFKTNSLIYLSNACKDTIEVEGVRYTPFNIVNCVYDKWGCHIELDYLANFYTYYQSAAALSGIEKEVSVHTFAFSDTDKLSFAIDIENTFNAYSFDSVCYYTTSLKQEGDVNMYIESINANTYIQFKNGYKELYLNDDYTIQASLFPLLSFENGFTKEMFLEMSGTVFKRYKEYYDFEKMFDKEYYPFTIDRYDFDEAQLLLLVFDGENHLFIDRNKIFTSITINNESDGKNVTSTISLGDSNEYAQGFEVYLIWINFDTSKTVDIKIVK